jgi:hypothetical protein
MMEVPGAYDIEFRQEAIFELAVIIYGASIHFESSQLKVTKQNLRWCFFDMV